MRCLGDCARSGGALDNTMVELHGCRIEPWMSSGRLAARHVIAVLASEFVGDSARRESLASRSPGAENTGIATMESLDALDNAMAQEGEDRHVASSVVAPKAALPQTPTRIGRPRGGLLGRARVAMSKSPGGASVSHSDCPTPDSFSSAMAPFDPTEEAGGAAAGKFCAGCKRSPSSPCFLGPGTVTWALPNNRGAWCKDCFGCWRLLYAGKATLVMFGLYSDRPENIGEWEVSWVSYMSLRKEGFDRLSEQQVVARREALGFAAKMCIPMGAFEIVRVKELSAVKPCGFLEGISLTTLATVEDDGRVQRELACMVPAPVGSGASSIERPRDLSWLGYWSRAHISCTKPAEAAELLKDSFGDSEFDLAPGVSSAVSSDPGAGGCKIHQKMKMVLTFARSQAHALSVATWIDLRESFFTSPIMTLTALKAEASAVDVLPVVREVDEWTCGMSQAKLFLKKYRECTKQQKVDRISMLSPALDNLCEFMSDKSLPGYPTLLLLKLKVQFMCGSGRMSDFFGKMADHGLDFLLSLAHGKANIPIESWLRTMIFQRLSEELKALNVQKCDEQRPIFLKDLLETVSILGGLSVAEVIQPLLNDLRSLSVVFEAGVPDSGVKAIDAEKADACLDSPRFGALHSA